SGRGAHADRHHVRATRPHPRLDRRRGQVAALDFDPYPLAPSPWPGRGGWGSGSKPSGTMAGTSMTTQPSREQLLWMYDRMSLIRQFEERLKQLVDQGLPVGATHYYVGEEAVAVGVCAALRQTDWIASTHRGHGHCIAKGVDVAPMMAELY